MAINPELISLIKPQDVPNADAKLSDEFFFFEGNKLKKTPISKIPWVQEVTNIINNNIYELDPEQIVPSEALYNDTPETLAGDVLKRVDKKSGVNVNYREVLNWHDGTVMTDAKVDSVKYFKKGVKYYENTSIGYDADNKFFGNTKASIDLITSSVYPFRNIIISNDVDLNGLTLNLPANIGLKFNGGVLKNGVLNGNNTNIQDLKKDCFSNLIFTGTFNIDQVKTIFFKETSDDLVFEKGLQLASLNSNKTLYVSRRNYTIANPINVRACSLIGEDENLNGALFSISYSGNVSAITINAVSTYAMDGFRLENLTLKYTGLNTNRVPAILNNSQLTKANYFVNIIGINFTSYVFMQNRLNYIQEAHFENIRGSGCGGLFGYDSTPVGNFPWNIVSIDNCSIDNALNAYMVEPICIDMLGASTVSLKGIVLQGGKGAMVADTVDVNGKTIYGFTTFRTGWLGVSINHNISIDGLWVEFTNSTATRKVITISGKGGSFKLEGLKGIENLFIDTTVQSADIKIQSDWIVDYTGFVDNRSAYAGLNIDLKLFSANSPFVFTDKGDLYKMTNNDNVSVIRKSYFQNPLDMPYVDLSNFSVTKYYGGLHGAVYNGGSTLLTGSLNKDGNRFYTRFIVTNRLSINIPIVNNYTPRVLIVAKVRISLKDSDLVSDSQNVQIVTTNTINATSRPGGILGGTRSFTLDQSNRTSGWITIAYMVNNHIDERVFIFTKSKTDEINIDVSHVFICKGNKSLIDRDFLETDHSFLEVEDAALANITSYVSSDAILVKNKNSMKILKNGVLKGIGEVFPQSYTTALRPTATSVGNGFQIFDTTLNKPIWSTGTVWVDATGTTV